jgi:regulator of protease activity HflC (stomatin/prohibitin superfamily)
MEGVMISIPNFTRRQKLYGAFAAAGLLTVYSTVFRVDQTESAVITTFGRATSVAGPGLNWKIPFIQGRTNYPTDVQTIDVTQNRPSCNANGGSQNDTGNTTYTKDQQFVYASATAQFVLPSDERLIKIHGKYQNYSAFLTNYLNQGMKEVLGGYNTTDIPAARAIIAGKIGEAMKTQIDAESIPLGKPNVQFRNFDFSCQYEAQVENAAQAKTTLTRNETELAIQKVQKDKTIVDAEATKEKATLEGQGEAAKILSRAEAEAKGIQLMQTALANSPYVVDYERAKRWNGQLPVNVYGSAPIPFLDVSRAPTRPGPVADSGTAPAAMPN